MFEDVSCASSGHQCCGYVVVVVSRGQGTAGGCAAGMRTRAALPTAVWAAYMSCASAAGFPRRSRTPCSRTSNASCPLVWARAGWRCRPRRVGRVPRAGEEDAVLVGSARSEGEVGGALGNQAVVRGGETGLRLMQRLS